MPTVVHRVFLGIAAGCLACGFSLASAQTTTSVRDQSSFDNFRPVDSETLLANALAAIENKQFRDAGQFISDALQVIKVNHGLLSTKQFPALQLLAATDLAQQDWQGFDQHLAYFEWLLKKLAVSDFEAFLSGSQILHSLYLDAAATGNNPNNAHYLIAAKQLNWRAVTAIELTHGKDSLRLAPWLYNIVLTHYYQSTLTRRRGLTSYDYKSTTPEIVSGWTLSKNESLEQSFGIGQELLLRIRTLYASSIMASPMTDALMLLYMADWELLFSRNSEALEFYRSAYALVKNTNSDAAALNAWFNQPVIIPRRNFADSWQPDSRSSSVIDFIAWSAVFPGAQRPDQIIELAMQPVGKYSASVRFDLVPGTTASATTAVTGVEASSNRHFSVINNLSLEAITPDNELVARQARSRIAELQFRPLLVDGELASGNNFQLNYVFSAETDFSMLSDAN